MHDFLSLTKGGAQQDKIQGGAWGLVQRIFTQELAEEVQLHAKVTHVYDHETQARALGLGPGMPSGGVSVVTADGRVRVARALVMALPLSLAPHVRHLPALPTRARAAAGSPMGSVIKVLIEFAQPFWLDQGFSGLSISDDGPVSLTYDASLGTRGRPSFRPALVAFCLGRSARDWGERPREERRRAVLAAVGRIHAVADAAALQPVMYFEQDWCKEPHAGGGYVCASAPGVMTNYGHALSPAAGCVSWCGADVALEWQGYMEGALCSAEKAAAEVPVRLDSPTSSIAAC